MRTTIHFCVLWCVRLALLFEALSIYHLLYLNNTPVYPSSHSPNLPIHFPPTVTPSSQFTKKRATFWCAAATCPPKAPGSRCFAPPFTRAMFPAASCASARLNWTAPAPMTGTLEFLRSTSQSAPCSFTFDTFFVRPCFSNVEFFVFVVMSDISFIRVGGLVTY